MKTWGELENPGKGELCVNLLVENLEETHEVLEQGGAKIVYGPKETIWAATS